MNWHKAEKLMLEGKVLMCSGARFSIDSLGNLMVFDDINGFKCCDQTYNELISMPFEIAPAKQYTFMEAVAVSKNGCFERKTPHETLVLRIIDDKVWVSNDVKKRSLTPQDVAGMWEKSSGVYWRGIE